MATYLTRGPIADSFADRVRVAWAMFQLRPPPASRRLRTRIAAAISGVATATLLAACGSGELRPSNADQQHADQLSRSAAASAQRSRTAASAPETMEESDVAPGQFGPTHIYRTRDSALQVGVEVSDDGSTVFVTAGPNTRLSSVVFGPVTAPKRLSAIEITNSQPQAQLDCGQRFSAGDNPLRVEASAQDQPSRHGALTETVTQTARDDGSVGCAFR